MPPRQTRSGQPDDPGDGNNSWGEWANYVFAEIKRLSVDVSEIKKERVAEAIEVAQLKVKSSVWGAVGGLITVLTALAIAIASGILQKGNQSQQQKPQDQSAYHYSYGPKTSTNPTGRFEVPEGYKLVPYENIKSEDQTFKVPEGYKLVPSENTKGASHTDNTIEINVLDESSGK
jgi:hypothetical protein